MNSKHLRWPAITFVIGLFTVFLPGCVVSGDGYGYDGGVGIGVDYYEPYGDAYGGWGPGYRVGPYRGGEQRLDRGGGHQLQHAYHSAPVSHSMPSIPSHSRSGGRSRSH